MRIVVCHNEAGQWWWSAVSDSGQTAAVSSFYTSRTDCMRGVAELKVEGPAALVTYEETYTAGVGTRTISSVLPPGSKKRTA